jgi:hypothetical protein
MVTPGDASPLLPRVGRSWAAMVLAALWVATPCHSLAVLLQVSVNVRRGHNCAPSCTRLLFVPTSVPLGSQQDLLCPLGLSWCGFRMRCWGYKHTWEFYRRATGSPCGPCCHSKTLGEKLVGGGGAILITDGVPSGPYRLVLAQARLGVE